MWTQGGADNSVHELAGIIREYADKPLDDEVLHDEIDDVSRAYRDMPPLDPSVVPLWQALGALVVQQCDQLRNVYQIIRLDDRDPYATAEEMHADIDRGIYQVTSMHSNHPVWDVDTNVAFRCVHDILGHGTAHSDFSYHGEVMAYRAESAVTPQELWPVLFTEIVAQSAYVNVHHLFGEQKVGLIPLTIEEIEAHVGQVMDQTADLDWEKAHTDAPEVAEQILTGGSRTTAATGSFRGKLDGQVQKFTIGEGQIMDGNGNPVDPSRIIYPTFDPMLGLTPRTGAVAEGYTHRTAEVVRDELGDIVPQDALPVTFGEESDPADDEELGDVTSVMRERHADRREAMVRESLRKFTPAEKDALINEGTGGSRNSDRLNVADTHYQNIAELEPDDAEWLLL